MHDVHLWPAKIILRTPDGKLWCAESFHQTTRPDAILEVVLKPYEAEG